MQRLLALTVTAVLVVAVGGTPAHSSAPAPAATPTVAAAVAGTRVCVVDDERLTELSGLVATSNGYVVINDGSDEKSRRQIFFLDRSCLVTRAVPYPSRPRDTEDLARAPDGTIWVADIGDNNRNRDTVALWKLAPGARAPVLHRLTYPDGAHDAEAFLLAGDGTPIVVTKDPRTPGLYAPAGAVRPDRTVPMRKVGQVTLPRTTTSNPFYSIGRQLVTGAALAPAGDRVVLRTYADAIEFDVADGDVIRAITDGVPRITPLPDEPQGEAITYTPDGAALLTVSEITEESPDGGPSILRYTPPAGPRPEATSTSPADGAESGRRTLKSEPDKRLIGVVGAVGLILAAAGFLLLARRRR